ncbi:MAG: thiol-activated cytolysin family protein [Bacteroidales bacterium]|nr:thiol-activated cytolysin family protein [Bacteroidales bacterium]
MKLKNLCLIAAAILIVGAANGQSKKHHKIDRQQATQKEATQRDGSQTNDKSKSDKGSKSKFKNEQTNSNTSNNKSGASSIRDVLQKYEDKDSPAALTRVINEAATPAYLIVGSDLLELRSTPVDVKTEKSTDLFCNEGTSLYPGCLVYVNSDLRDGNAVPVTNLGYGRVKVTLDIDTGGANSVEAENSYSGIQDAIRKLVRQAYSSGYHQPARSGYISDDYTSTQKMAIDVGCDVGYAGAKLKVETTTTSSSTKIVHFEDLSMIYYSVHVEPLNGDITNLFGKNTTGEQVEKAIKKYGQLAYVSDMNYGCRIYHFTDYEASDFSFKGSENASYSGNSVSSKQDITKNTKNKKERVFVWGGPQGMVSGMCEDEATVKKTLKAVADKTGFNISSKNQGLPIGLKTTFVASGRLCQRSTSGKYNEVSYVKHPKIVSLKITMDVDGVAGCRVKPRVDYRTLIIDPKTKKIVKKQIVKDPLEETFSGNGSSVKKTWNKTIKLGENEFIDGNLWFGVRTKAYSESKWTQAIDGFVDPVACNGNVTIWVKGDTRSRTYIGKDSPVGCINQTKGKY